MEELARLKILEEEEAKFLKEEELAVKFLEEEEAVTRSIYLNKSATSLEIRADFMKKNEVLVKENNDLHRQVAELKDRLAELEKNKICKEEQAQSVVCVAKIMEAVRHFETVRNKRKMFLNQRKMLLKQKEDAS